ncbi:hypothetical protein Ntsu_35430 [Nocardia sp. IFM 10818]
MIIRFRPAIAGHPRGMNPETDPADMLDATESLDSDDVRNEDGDEVVAPPDEWQAADRDEMTARGQREGESHADRLAEEVAEGDGRSTADLDDPNLVDTEDDRPTRRHRGQVSGAPEDGDSFFPGTA